MPNKSEQIEKLTVLNDDLENYFRNTIIPQLFVDANLILRKYSPPAIRQFNLSENDIGKSILDIKENFRYPTLMDNINHVISTHEILEKEIQSTDNRWYQMNIIPYLRLRDNTTNGVIISFVEITMRVKDLKDLEQLISDHEILLDTISHDIKTPITSLVLAIELFKDVSPGDPEEFQSLLHVVENSIKKIQNLVSELTDTRKQAHKYKVEAELLSFEHILEDVRLTLNDIIIETGTIITSEINVSQINFPRRKLRSVLYNLVNNAIKFRLPHRRPEIMITTSREENYITISVKDNGMGIGANNMDAVFTKYFRIENKSEGSGIGLYLVREIVNSLGGKITLKSEPDKGSEFKVYLKME
jgi:two-component system, OmpR family, phosphate regulon sensor histidine kinase PhoR